MRRRVTRCGARACHWHSGGVAALVTLTDDVQLCVDSIGKATDPPVLLISGFASSMDWWPDELCERLAAGGRFVIRYDHRDTGRSITYPPGAAPYSWTDLMDDVPRLLDALGLPSAHLVGFSMGGAFAQLVALHHRDRARSLVLMSTTAGGADLPAMSDELKTFYDDRTDPDWANRAAVIDHMLAEERALSGSLPFDEATRRAVVARTVDRSINIAASANHGKVQGAPPWSSRLGEIRAPTLVVHGTEDPLFPLTHGTALALAIPSATLLPLERVGHEMPPQTWNLVLPAILRHTN
jgi:pimeloyl-ACP methyl ester carboxylesterase